MLTFSKLKKEIYHLNSKHYGITTFVCMLNYGTNSLDETLGVGKSSKDMKGIGYTGKSSNSQSMFITLV